MSQINPLFELLGIKVQDYSDYSLFSPNFDFYTHLLIVWISVITFRSGMLHLLRRKSAQQIVMEKIGTLKFGENNEVASYFLHLRKNVILAQCHILVS